MPIFRASELDRLFACPGSALLPRKDYEGAAAAWGSKVHAWMETGLLPEGKDGEELEKRIKKSGIKREDFWPSGEFEVTYAYNILSRRVVKCTVPTGHPSPKKYRTDWKDAFDDEWATGSLDFEGTLMGSWWVDDLKTGRNAHWKNYEAQQLFYSLCSTLHKYGDYRSGRSTVAHWPRYPIARPPQRMGVSVDSELLVDFAQRLVVLRKQILALRPWTADKLHLDVLAPGDQCWFCPSKTFCPKITKKE